jgi:type III restriction enzyme
MGTPAFMDFVETINDEGVELEKRAMGKDTEVVAPVVIEIDKNDKKKDIEKLDIEIPKLSRRFARNFKRLEDLDITSIVHSKVVYKNYTEDELREIVFKEITTTDFSHTTQLSTLGDIDSTQAIGWFAMKIQTDLRLVGGYDVIYGKLKDFIRSYLFDQIVDLEDRNTMRNLSESKPTMDTLEGFKKAINELTLQDSGSAVIVDSIKLRDTKSFPVNDQEYVVPRKSIFNRIVGDSYLELRFANYLDECEDVITFAKLYQQIGMKIDYIDNEGKIRDYYPDFIVKLKDDRVFIVETKGAVDVDVPRKIERLKLWCEDVNKQSAESKVIFDFVYVQDKDFDELLKTYTEGLLKGKGKLFSYLVDLFRDYKD